MATEEWPNEARKPKSELNIKRQYPMRLNNSPGARGKKLEPDPDCVHHWLIDPPAGIFSRGKCKKCGKEREFSNSSEVNPFSYLTDKKIGGDVV